METVRDEVIARYFDLVQEEIKKLAKADGIKDDKIQQINDEIVNMGSIDNKLKPYIDQAAVNDLDIKRIAKEIYKDLGPKVKNNLFNQNDPNGVPNKLKGERKIQNFGEFLNELYREPEIVKPKWNNEDFRSLYNQLVDKVKQAEDILDYQPTEYPKLLSALDEVGTGEANELIEDIMRLVDTLQTFTQERELELSKLN